LTTEFLDGNWSYVDSLCDPDPNNGGYNYGEMYFNDSISASCNAYPGIGPTFFPYKIEGNNISNEYLKTTIEILDSNTINLIYICDWENKTTFRLSRMV
jgi:hypothetical protein